MSARKSFSLSCRVKRIMSPSTRHQLCRVLLPRFGEAVVCGPDLPLCVQIGEDIYELSGSIRSPGKVHIGLG